MELTMTATPSAHDCPLLIGTILTQGVARAPGQEIVYADRARYSYRELEGRVHRLAGTLAALGVRPGHTVGVMDWDSHRYLECFFAIPMMGAVLHTINVRLSPEQVLYTINHARDDVLLVNREFLSMLAAVADQIENTNTRFVLLDDGDVSPLEGFDFEGEYESLLAAAPERYAFPELDENTRATTFYTTGTTGLPKGVFFSHRQLVLHTVAGRALERGTAQGELTTNDVYMPLTPMFHVHAWGVPYQATLKGVKQVYPGRYDPARLVRLFQEEGVTFSHCVPTIFQMIVGCEAARGVDFSGWKVTIGGAALPPSMCRKALEQGIDITAGYGMSETCPILTLALLPRDLVDADIDTQVAYRCRAGRPVPMVQLRVVDADMNDVPHDDKTPGEIVVRAPWLTQGYLHDAEHSEVLWAGGWLHTGDIGVMSADGWLRITDRIKDVIKTGGEWVSSVDLENLILQHPAVAECAVIGVPDEKWGERPLALVVARPDLAIEPDSIIELLQTHVDRGHIPRYGIPDRVAVVESLPRTSVGKLDKKLMRQTLAQE